MPELPEVETIKQGLRQHVLGQQIRRVSIYSPRLRYPIDLAPEALVGQQITDIDRRSKYLLFQLSHDRFICHLGMSGRLWVINKNTPRKKHDHVDIELEHVCLRYNDSRRFGLLLMVDNFHDHKLLKKLGPEPLSKNFNTDYLKNSMSTRKIAIKQAIMNGHIVVGVGNIYANEALFLAKIHPETPCCTLNKAQCAELVDAIKSTLKSAIQAGGTTLKDFTNVETNPGYFAQKLMVYGRKNEKCFTCDSLIRAMQQQQRSSFYCETCQPFNADRNVLC